MAKMDITFFSDVLLVLSMNTVALNLGRQSVSICIPTSKGYAVDYTTGLKGERGNLDKSYERASPK